MVRKLCWSDPYLTELDTRIAIKGAALRASLATIGWQTCNTLKEVSTSAVAHCGDLDGAKVIQFFEVVKITSSKGMGLEGIVLGMAQDDQDKWGYAVHVYRDQEVSDFKKMNLSITRRQRSWTRFDENFYDGAR